MDKVIHCITTIELGGAENQLLILVKEQYDKFLNRSEVLRIENSNKFSLTKMKEVFSSLIQSKVMVPTKVNLILPKLNKVYGKS